MPRFFPRRIALLYWLFYKRVVSNKMNIDIRILTPQDLDNFIELIRVFEDVFEMKNFTMPVNKHLQGILNKINFLALTVQVDKRIVGGLTVYILDQYYSEKPLAYIYDLAILTQYQRQGIGKKLIKYLTDYCKKNGFEEVFVQADKVDRNATDFYRSTNISDEEQLVHFYYSLHTRSSST